MVNFGPLTAEIDLAGLGHPSKFQRVSRFGFVTAPTSLIGGQPNVARCLAVSWAGTLYIHFRGLLPCNRILPGGAKFTLRPRVAFSYIGSVTAWHSSSGRQPNCGVQHTAWQPSRWASAHILVFWRFHGTKRPFRADVKLFAHWFDVETVAA